VGLIVRFVPISLIVEWASDLPNTSLEVPSFEQEVYFETEKETNPNMQFLELQKQIRKDHEFKSARELSCSQNQPSRQYMDTFATPLKGINLAYGGKQ
jgi:hypothetical protein